MDRQFEMWWLEAGAGGAGRQLVSNKGEQMCVLVTPGGDWGGPKRRTGKQVAVVMNLLWEGLHAGW